MLLTDYISEYLTLKKIKYVFGVTGGYAMFLNNSLGINKDLKNIYTHNEQGAGYMAVGYSKSTNSPCVVSTTAGVAATNTISSVLVAWQESLPILYISGQVNNHETIKANPSLRHYSGQDCNICELVKSITKYSFEIHNAEEIKYHLDKIFFEFENGRKGPCFLSVPINIQNTQINPENLKGFEHSIPKSIEFSDNMNLFLKLINESKRPLILGGNGIKQSDSIDVFKQFLDKTNIPSVFSYNGVDIISTTSPFYVGRCGINGDRVGNFAIQNCDLLISLGCRLSLGVIGYNSKTFSRESKKIMIDIDKTELNKNNIELDLIINSDVKKVLSSILKLNLKKTDNDWVDTTLRWKKKWFTQLPPNVDPKSPYKFYESFLKVVPNNSCLIGSSGAIHTPLIHSFNDYGKNIKFIMNSATGDMGSELPGSLGVYFSKLFDKVIAVIGDGSFMFNIQELQTISYHKPNIKIIIMNNGGYESIRVSQKNYFGNILGTHEETGLSFPNFENIANAFNLNYFKFDSNFKNLEEVLNNDECTIIEVICCSQDRHPKLSSKKDEVTGVIVSKPLEDMFPFLDRDEFIKEMIVEPLKE